MAPSAQQLSKRFNKACIQATSAHLCPADDISQHFKLAAVQLGAHFGDLPGSSQTGCGMRFRAAGSFGWYAAANELVVQDWLLGLKWMEHNSSPVVNRCARSNMRDSWEGQQRWPRPPLRRGHCPLVICVGFRSHRFPHPNQQLPSSHLEKQLLPSARTCRANAARATPVAAAGRATGRPAGPGCTAAVAVG